MAQDPDGASTMNSQGDFADLKSHFFNHVCPCGNSDRAHFSYIEEDGEVLLRECTKCHDIIGLDDSTYDEVVSWQGDTENIRVSLCACCGNEKPDAIDVVFEQIDPKSAWQLLPGDHVMWKRSLGYSHHAIVVQCSKSDCKYVRVIHYTSPEGKPKLTIGMVAEEWVDLFKQNGDLYRVEYKPEAVLDSDEVVSRARSHLGEAQYNLLTNNCEHFASWCKTGRSVSKQVTPVLVHTATGVKAVTCTGAKVGALYTVRESFAALASKTVTVTGKKLCSAVSGAAGATVVVGTELYSFGRDVKKQKEQLLDGEISQQECIKIVVERGGRTGFAIVGTIAGSFIPIPVVGPLIGCTLGSLIGKYYGRLTSGLVERK